MPPKSKYKKPQLRVIQPTDARWRDHLPRVRDLTQQALAEIEVTGSADIVAKLETLLEMIDAEIAPAEENSNQGSPSCDRSRPG